MALPDWPTATRERLATIEAALRSFNVAKLEEDAQAVRLGLVNVAEARRIVGEAERGVLLASVAFDRPGMSESSALVQSIAEAIYRGVCAAHLLYQPWAHERYRWTSKRPAAGRAALAKRNAQRQSKANERYERIRAIKRERPHLTHGGIKVQYELKYGSRKPLSLDVISRGLRSQK